MSNFLEFYKKQKTKLDSSIEEFNKRLLKEKNLTINDNLKVYSDLNKSGKMIRGTLIMLGYKLNNNNLDYSIPLATAYEGFETSILVHDDIIDNDNFRRGKPTIHSYNEDKYNNIPDNKHLSESMALCIGDLGLYNANKIIIDNYKDDKNFSKILSKYNDIVIDTIRGEIIDVITPFEEKNNIFKGNTEETTMDIYRLKTSYYTLVGPMSLGMILGNSKENEIKDIEEFTLPLGIAFQIQDDILGIFSSNETLGKPIGSDIREFKQTLLYAHIKETDYYKELLNHYGKEEFDIEKVKQLFIDSKSLEYCQNKMNTLYEESLNKLNKIAWLKEEDKEILKDLVEFLRSRKK